MIARALVVLAAFGALVALAGELRVARDVERAAQLAEGGPSPAEVTEAVTLLRRAATRTADTAPLLREAQLRLFVRQPGAALGPARAAERREPENAQAWLLVAQAAAGVGAAALEREARRRVAALVARP